MAKRRIDETVRQRVKKAHEEGIARKEISEQFGISLSSVGRILRQEVRPGIHQDGPVNGYWAERRKRIEDLEKRVLELERKILAYEAKKRIKDL